MLLLKIIGLLLSVNSFSVENTGSLWPESATLNSNIGNFSVSIESSSYQELLNSKNILKAKYYWSKNKTFFDCEEKNVCSAFLKKLTILTGSPLSTYLEKYSLVEKINGWHKYRDTTGTKDYSDVSLKFDKNELNIIQKKPTGTEYITFTFQTDKEGYFLDSVEHKSFIGLQKFRTVTNIEYSDHQKVRLPSRLVMQTDQSLITSDLKTPKRKVSEIYVFKKYLINSNSNLNKINVAK